MLTIDSLQKNEIGISSSNLKAWTKNNGVVFFCTRDYSIQEYKKQLEFFETSKIDSTTPPYLYFILFNEYDQISKNPFLINSGIGDSIITQIECYLVCSNKKNVDRAMRIFAENYTLLNQIEGENIFHIGIKGSCPKDLTYSISLFYDLIYEIFNPQYSSEEKLELQGESIKLLTKEVERLKAQIKELEEEMQKSSETFDNRLKKLENPKKKGNEQK
jgi:hypothetical protein